MGSGRRGTGDRPYRRNRDRCLAASDLCALCGHGGAETVDHIIPDKFWPRGDDGKRVPGFDGLDNLQPAHGTMGVARVNRCPVCGLLCNQVKGDRVDFTSVQDAQVPASTRSRRW